jgi:hypothetical protein
MQLNFPGIKCINQGGCILTEKISMKTGLLSCILLVTIAIQRGWSQDRCDTVYAVPEKIAEYKQGSKSLLTYLQQELVPAISDCMRREGEVIASLYIVLTIDDRGKVTDAKFTRPALSSACTAALKKKLLTMKGWHPAQAAGRDVCSEFKWPIGCLKWNDLTE